MPGLERRETPGPSLFPLDAHYISSLGSVVRSDPLRFVRRKKDSAFEDFHVPNRYLANAVLEVTRSYEAALVLNSVEAAAIFLGNSFAYDVLTETARRRGLIVPTVSREDLVEYDRRSSEKEVDVEIDIEDVDGRLRKFTELITTNMRGKEEALMRELGSIDYSRLREPGEIIAPHLSPFSLQELAELGAEMVYDPIAIALERAARE